MGGGGGCSKGLKGKGLAQAKVEALEYSDIV